MCRPFAPICALLLALLPAPALLAPTPAGAWTSQSQKLLGEQAARLAPPDLYRQLARNRPAFLVGLEEPFRAPSEDRFAFADGRGKLKRSIRLAVDHAVASIRAHRPFNDIAYRMGVVAHYLALANNPLYTADGDAQQKRWARDYLQYLERTEPRLELVFYGFQAVDRPFELDALLERTLARSRGHYPLLSREYRRIGYAPGVQAFDDRSTAYALAALGHSHAISDIAEVLRYIWLESGGIDDRAGLPRRGRQLLRLRPPTKPPVSR